MNSVPKGRVGLQPEVTAFVVREELPRIVRVRRTFVQAQERGGAALDSGFSAVLASFRAGFSGLRQALRRPRDPVEQAAADPVAVEMVELPLPEAEIAPRGRIFRIDAIKSDLRMRLAALAIHAARLERFAKDRWSERERLKDFLALVRLFSMTIARLLWRAPRFLQVGALAALVIALAPWPRWPVNAGAPRGESVAFDAATPARAREPADVWVAVSAPIPSYYLEAPELDRVAPRYRARRQNGGGRQDIMAFGDFGPAPQGKEGTQGAKARPVGIVSIEYYPGGQPAGNTLFVEAARRAAIVGASVERVAQSTEVPTKFGVLDVADATLASDAGPRACLVFRHIASGVPLQLHGWFCGAANRPIDRTTLSCIIDRVDLLGAGDNAALKAYFAEVERARKSCGGYRSAGMRTSWLDPAGKMPALKSSLPDKARRK